MEKDPFDERYNKGGNKVIDWLIGFFAPMLIGGGIQGVFYIIMMVIGTTMPYETSETFMSIFGLLIIAIQCLLLVALIVAIIYSFQKVLKFIGIGIISFLVLALVVPLILMGGCFVLFAGMASMSY